ncbi:TPA: TonB family protein [Klebsiella pneumoniae]|nr:TonB family protein [Klebsiella pneumoniae]
MQMDADAQAGGDAFNIGAGSSGGMAGSGAGRIGNATYGQYLGYALQKVLRETDATRNLAYRMNVDLWIDRDGRVRRVEMTRSSGDPEIDEKVLAVLRAATFDQRPTPTTTMPAKVALTSRRPS